jgi:hypothetical protein
MSTYAPERKKKRGRQRDEEKGIKVHIHMEILYV